jgi:trimethylamine---corrinoid protein Co-methyltransferase
MPSFSLLTPEHVEAIHQATLRILSEIGVVLTHAGGREILTAAGARIRSGRVLLPAELVETCLAQCPRTVSVRGRGGTLKTLGDGSLRFHSVGGARDVFDYRTGQKRHAGIQDVRDSARVLDALENCHTITPSFSPREVPGELMSLASYRHALPQTTKPVHGPVVQHPGEVKFALEMSAVIGEPAKVLTLAVSPVSPLAIPDNEVGAIIEVARAGITFLPLPCPTAGMTAPLSVAGAVAEQNAEVLALLVLAQLVHPGLPTVYCGRLAMMEPRTGTTVWGGVELALASAGTIQIGHRYNLPVNVSGFSTNAHSLDLQCGFERAINAAVPALAGADELSGIGEMEAGVSGSLAQMVADNEFASSVLRLRRGVAADADALAVDVIGAVMDGSRTFLDQKHTMKYLKAGEVFVTRLAERGTFEQWDAAGRDNLADRAQAEAERILREHQVAALDVSQERELDAIMSAAEKELVK